MVALAVDEASVGDAPMVALAVDVASVVVDAPTAVVDVASVVATPLVAVDTASVVVATLLVAVDTASVVVATLLVEVDMATVVAAMEVGAGRSRSKSKVSRPAAFAVGRPISGSAPPRRPWCQPTVLRARSLKCRPSRRSGRL
jgi:hypothetical protein